MKGHKMGYYHLVEKHSDIVFGTFTGAMYFSKFKFVKELFWEFSGLEEIP